MKNKRFLNYFYKSIFNMGPMGNLKLPPSKNIFHLLWGVQKYRSLGVVHPKNPFTDQKMFHWWVKLRRVNIVRNRRLLPSTY